MQKVSPSLEYMGLAANVWWGILQIGWQFHCCSVSFYVPDISWLWINRNKSGICINIFHAPRLINGIATDFADKAFLPLVFGAGSGKVFKGWESWVEDLLIT